MHRLRTAFTVLALFYSLPGNVVGDPLKTIEGSSKAISIGSKLQLFLDDELIESMHDLELRLHSPRRAEVAIKKDKPWEDSTMFDPVVIKDESGYRMWYRTNYNAPPFYTGYAKSDDGVRWTKPSLGLVEFRGEKNNNLVWSSGPDKSAPYVLCVFKDNKPQTPASQRYKAIGVRRQPQQPPMQAIGP